MREILFRGKRKDNGKWVFGCYYKQTEFYGEKAEASMIITSGESLCYDQALDYYAVSEKTVGQFTGLYDSTKWEDLTDAEKFDFYHQHYIGEDGMSVRFQKIDDVKHLWKGKKIFEGDVLKFHENIKTSVIGKCIFECGTFAFEYTDLAHGIDLEWFSFSDDSVALPEHCMEVIGNIHDNPELLETT